MKKIFAMIILCPALAHSFITIHSQDPFACLNNWMTMRVEVLVENEQWFFEPFCQQSNFRGFVTQSGMRCQVQAGMCSNFMPQRRFEVQCDNGDFGSIMIDCPPR